MTRTSGLILTFVLLAAAGAALAQNRYNLFISPMGEPFRANVSKPFPSGVWFAGADANHDGVVTKEEFRADALRFFKTLDKNGDGRLRDDEILYYEKQVAPEIVANSFDTSDTKPEAATENSMAQHTQLAPVRQGASNFSSFNDPEPVRSADTDFNLKVTQEEWMAAADRRFKALDKAGTGGFKLADLPPTPSQGKATP